ncbi:MAG: winged helix-turn-helix transcriptional regulator [Methanobrevibacter sp.]|uniref:MarR family winged helix-turn-helix transcriptional regulator n=1 Tax=Methanobrevibacter sp. TaxID=66852 RepID=UPI0025FDDED0|nr:MarR family winged helix-turn-helix transcriptional regulator [Methanobrevibacter sp.]MBE6507823.1 winged helix-turn-helix transcriptional regulator [Methanobrevibacter sp.]
MEDESFQGIFDNSPFIAWIHNISKNQMKYLNSKIKDMNLGHEMRYIMAVYDNQGISQDDLVAIFGQSKASIAKSVKKLEDQGYIERKINQDNRRKYMLNTTSKANELVPKIRQISKDWEKEVGITDEDIELRRRIKEIAVSGMKLVEDL